MSLCVLLSGPSSFTSQLFPSDLIHSCGFNHNVKLFLQLCFPIYISNINFLLNFKLYIHQYTGKFWHPTDILGCRYLKKKKVHCQYALSLISTYISVSIWVLTNSFSHLIHKPGNHPHFYFLTQRHSIQLYRLYFGKKNTQTMGKIRSWQDFSINVQIINTLNFVYHIVSIATTQFCCCNEKQS